MAILLKKSIALLATRRAALVARLAKLETQRLATVAKIEAIDRDRAEVTKLLSTESPRQSV